MPSRFAHVSIAALIAGAIGFAPGNAGAVTLCDGVAATIVGTSNGETITGTSGADVIAALGGDDIINALGGNDRVCGGDGNDTIVGGPGNDRILGEADTYTGFAGLDIEVYGGDTVSFAGAPTSVVADLAFGTASGHGADTLIGVENLIGSAHADTLAGNERTNRLEGGLGADNLDGRDGAFDWVAYTSASGPVVVDLGAQTATGAAGTDSFTGIEAASGSRFADTLRGGPGLELLDGLAGNDTLEGAGSYDWFRPGPGNDSVTSPGGNGSVYYDRSATAVRVNLGTGTATGEGTDTLVGIFSVYGSPLDDVLTGGPVGERLVGDAGDDILRGNGGQDVLVGETLFNTNFPAPPFTTSGKDHIDGGAAEDTIVAGRGTDTIVGGAGRDLLIADHNDATTVDLPARTYSSVNGTGTVTGIEDVFATPGDDVLIGNSADNTLLGGLGRDRLEGRGGNDVLWPGAYSPFVGPSDTSNDIVRGGPGQDAITYMTATDSMWIYLHSGYSAGEGVDTITTVENVFGSPHDDVIYGDDLANTLRGQDGDDTIEGEGGNDILDGEGGDDQIYGGFGDDAIDGGFGDDICDGGGQPGDTLVSCLI